jgi:hypothetical protein
MNKLNCINHKVVKLTKRINLKSHMLVLFLKILLNQPKYFDINRNQKLNQRIIELKKVFLRKAQPK